MSFATDSAAKAEVLKKYQLHESDTGSPEAQIALLTERLKNMTDHFATHPKDKHSKLGLFAVVSKRKRLLSYLKRENIQRYRDALEKFGLRK